MAGEAVQERAAAELRLLEADIGGETGPADAGPAQGPGPAAQAGQVVDQGEKQLISALIHGTCRVVCPNWEITEAESDLLAEVYIPVLDKYLGSAWAESPEIVAILATLGIFGARQGKPRKRPPIEGAARQVDEPQPTRAGAEGSRSGHGVRPPKADA